MWSDQSFDLVVHTLVRHIMTHLFTDASAGRRGKLKAQFSSGAISARDDKYIPVRKQPLK